MHQQDRKLLDPPSADGERAEVEPAARQIHERPGVLVVDDDHLVRIMVQMGLERDGFEVWLARNGWEAIELYREHRDSVGVVLLDVRMPGLDGPATLDALRKLNPGVLVCFMSGDTGNYEPEDLRQRGAVHVIAKPFQLNELADVLRQLTRGESADLLPAGGTCRG
jgi:CheY-like chemotaxis protein